MVGSGHYFKMIQERLDVVFDVFEHVKGIQERQVHEEEVYSLLVELVHKLSKQEMVGSSINYEH